MAMALGDSDSINELETAPDRMSLTVTEEIDGGAEMKTFGFGNGNGLQDEKEKPFVNTSQQRHLGSDSEENGTPVTPEKATTATREWNISPISELLDNDDDDLREDSFLDEYEKELEKITTSAPPTEVDGAEKITPEENRPGHPAARINFPRISDGRSSPILSYSPTLLKSPSSNKSNKDCNSDSPVTDKSEKRVQRRPRNIVRMLENISDHSSEEREEADSSGDVNVDSVGVMMAKFTV